MSQAFEAAVARVGGDVKEETRGAIAVLIIASATAGERDKERLVTAGLRFGPKHQA